MLPRGERFAQLMAPLVAEPCTHSGQNLRLLLFHVMGDRVDMFLQDHVELR